MAFQAKGWDKDCDITIEAAEELFEKAGKAAYVKICRAGGKSGEKKKLSEFSSSAVLWLLFSFHVSRRPVIGYSTKLAGSECGWTAPFPVGIYIGGARPFFDGIRLGRRGMILNARQWSKG